MKQCLIKGKRNYLNASVMVCIVLCISLDVIIIIISKIQFYYISTSLLLQTPTIQLYRQTIPFNFMLNPYAQLICLDSFE